MESAIESFKLLNQRTDMSAATVILTGVEKYFMTSFC